MTKKFLTTEDVKNIAKLAKLSLTEIEIKKFSVQLNETVQYFNELSKIDTSNIISTSQVTGITNQYRDDIVTSSLFQEDTLKNSSKTKNGFFISKTIWD